MFRAEPLAANDDLRVLTEFDSTRSELFLAQAALLVEGATERLALPFAFKALGYDADREGVAIVECGGKGNIPLFARVCRAARIPFAVLHDRDRSDERLNEAIAALANEHVFALSPTSRARRGPDAARTSRPAPGVTSRRLVVTTCRRRWSRQRRRRSRSRAVRAEKRGGEHERRWRVAAQLAKYAQRGP